jgi:hypothetical protein
MAFEPPTLAGGTMSLDPLQPTIAKHNDAVSHVVGVIMRINGLSGKFQLPASCEFVRLPCRARSRVQAELVPLRSDSRIAASRITHATPRNSYSVRESQDLRESACAENSVLQHHVSAWREAREHMTVDS